MSLSRNIPGYFGDEFDLCVSSDLAQKREWVSPVIFALGLEGQCERRADGVVGGGLGGVRFLGEFLSVGFEFNPVVK